MNKLQQAIETLHEMDWEAGSRGAVSLLHPVSRLFVTLFFILVTVSFDKYDLAGLSSMVLYILVIGIAEDISLIKGFRHLWYVFGFLFVLGTANLFFDKTVLLRIGEFPVTGGMVSMATLFLKGALAVYATYFLMVSSGMKGICRALRSLGVPKGAVTVLLLTYRYLIVLLKEVQRMWQAYHLRAPGQRGIKLQTWGPFVGLLLLRSMDRAKTVYDSMLLRGYTGEFQGEVSEKQSAATSAAYVLVWAAVFVILRLIPVFQLVGGLLGA